MAINDKFEITPATANISAPVVITWTTNEPTAGVAPTIADGDAPTVAETGQLIQDMNTQLSLLQAAVAALQASIDS